MNMNFSVSFRVGLLPTLLFGFLHPTFAGIRPSFSLDYCSWHATAIVLVELTPDTDFAVKLDEILQNGMSVQLTSDLMRARYRDSLTGEKLVKPGDINCYEFSGFTFFSRNIAKGGRLRLSLSAPNSIQVEHNYNSGGVVAAESGKDARIAHINLYHDRQHQSFLELPIVK